MKKFLSLILALAMLACMSVTAFAADGTTTLTVEVPENSPSYMIKIPKDMTLEYGKTEDQLIGAVTISNPQNFADDQKVYAEVTGTNLKNGDDEIAVTYKYTWQQGETGFSTLSGSLPNKSWVFEKAGIRATIDQYPIYKIYASVAGTDWESATPGKYTATLTFTFTVK